MRGGNLDIGTIRKVLVARLSTRPGRLPATRRGCRWTVDAQQVQVAGIEDLFLRVDADLEERTARKARVRREVESFEDVGNAADVGIEGDQTGAAGVAATEGLQVGQAADRIAAAARESSHRPAP